MNSNKTENYLALLTIRRAALRRDMVILGGIFIVSFMAMIALGMIDQLSGRSVYLVAAIDVVFGFAYLSTWVRLEIVQGTIELVNNLLPQKNEG